MGDHTSPKRVMSRELEYAAKREQIMDALRGRGWVFSITEDSSTVTLDPRVWYSAEDDGVIGVWPHG